MKIIVASAFILICSLAKGQEFWLLPKKFLCTANEDAKVILLKGENFVGEPLTDKSPFEKTEVIQLTRQTALTTDPDPSKKNLLRFNLKQEGTYLFSAVGREAIIEKSAEEFNDYIKRLEQDEVLNERTKTNSLNKPVRENLKVFAKLILQCGSKYDETFKKQTGTQLEFIPQQNPASLKSGDYLQCLILYKSKPLPHHLIRIWNKIGNTSILQNAYTENDGIVKFPISSKGPWMISTIKTVPSEKPSADWQSFQSSLTFGIE